MKLLAAIITAPSIRKSPERLNIYAIAIRAIVRRCFFSLAFQSNSPNSCGTLIDWFKQRAATNNNIKNNIMVQCRQPGRSC